MLIDDLLKLSRVARASIQIEEVDLTQIANGIIAELRQREPERRVEVDIAPGLVADCDAHLMRVVLFNLLENAWKYTARASEAKIEFDRLDNAGPGAFFVRDNGIGFESTYASKIFEAFQRLHSSADYPGTGIGLATVARIIDRHGGTIQAASEPGTGTTFTFTV